MWGTAKALPNAKDHFSTIVVSGKIYVLGGEKGHHLLHQPQGDAHVYDPATDTWKALANLPLAKSHLEGSTFLSNGLIVMAGGQVDNFTPTGNVEAYNPATNTWSTLAPLPGLRQGSVLKRVGNTFVLAIGAKRSSEPQTTVWRATV